MILNSRARANVRARADRVAMKKVARVVTKVVEVLAMVKVTVKVAKVKDWVLDRLKKTRPADLSRA